MSAPVLLAANVNYLEGLLSDSPLDLMVLDRVGPLTQCAPEALLHRGVNVRPGASLNTGAYRDRDLARVQDTLTVEMAYKITPVAQRASRDSALLLEEQVRKLLTGAHPALAGHVAYQGTPSRGLHPADGTWWITVQNFTIDRDAVLGG